MKESDDGDVVRGREALGRLSKQAKDYVYSS
jgi:hypothetical protein